MVNFDEFSRQYGEVLDKSVSISGEGSAYFAEYKARYLAGAVGHDFSGKVLDYGCGIGLLSAFLIKHLPVAEIHGFDISQESIRMIGQELSLKGHFTSDMDSLAHDYRLIIVSNVMHHIRKEQRQETVNALCGRLAPGGRLTMLEHNPANPLTRRVFEHCPFDRDAVLVPPREAETYLIDSGLKPVRKDYIVFFPRMLSWLRFLEPFLYWCPLGAQYTLTGEKTD